MNSTSQTTIWKNVAGTVLLAALTVALGIGFLHAFAPVRPLVGVKTYEGYDRLSMDSALAPESVSNRLAAILACGSRYQGQPGFVQARRLVGEAFAAAGLETRELSQKILTPRTVRREILGTDGRLLSNVEIFPFMPNHCQPVVTPEGGCTAKLVLATDELLNTRERFDDCIAVIDVESPPTSYGIDWLRYAQVGFQGVILAHREGMARMRWETIGSQRASAPVNYLRLAATEGVFKHLDETVTIRAKVVWEESVDTTLVGILHAPKPASEAVVVTAFVDAPSVLPDTAPGTLAAVNLAAQLSVLQGMAAYRNDTNRTRDVVFVCYSSRSMGMVAADTLTSTLGHALDRATAGKQLVMAQSENAAQRARVAACQESLNDQSFMDDVGATAKRLKTLSADVRACFDTELRYVLNTLVLELSEVQLQARLTFLRENQDTSRPSFERYREAKARYDESMTMAGLPLAKLLGEPAARAFFDTSGLRGRIVARLHELEAHHVWRGRQLAQELAIHGLLGRYRQVIAASSFLAPAERERTHGEAVTFFMGGNAESDGLRQSPVINEAILTVVQRDDKQSGLIYEPLRGRAHNKWAESLEGSVPTDMVHWNAKGYPAFVLINTDRGYAYSRFGSPVDDPRLHDLETIRLSLRLLGRTVLALAYGQGSFEPALKTVLTTYSGRAFLSNVGRSIIPNYPLAGALIGHKGYTAEYAQSGYYSYPFLKTNPYGWYEAPRSSLALMTPNSPNGYSPEVVGFGPDGLIWYIKDDGMQGQRAYKSINAGGIGKRQNINIVAFRASPVVLYDTINPQTLSTYTGFSFLKREGLADVDKFNVFGLSDGIVVAMLEPDRRFFLTLKAGAPDNDKVQSIRAFLLGVDETFRAAPDREIDGRGYLVADTPVLREVSEQVAESMLSVNGRRLDLQIRHNMADKRVRLFHKRSQSLLAQSHVEGTPHHTAELDQRAAVTYATLNHSVLRRTVFEAVVGILWYLGLLVPFAFFFEKLAFGFADIRRQLAAQTGIFLVVFLLLRWLHPAFAMISSSLMILLGFVIMLISGGITLLFSGKFKENLEELQKSRGQVTAAEINTMGVLGTAFTLGLNNMHRRIVRTGLTCTTLVLLTFAMICFTSVQSDITDNVAAIGKAPYQGMLIKPERFKPISSAAWFALSDRYQQTCSLSARRMMVGQQGWDRVNYNPDLEASYEPASGLPKRRPVASILELGPEEPLRNGIRLLTQRGWFTTNMVKDEIDIPPVLIPDTLATSLGIRPSEVDAGVVQIKLSGKQVRVQGIFEAASLAAQRDLDGRDLLPFDIEAMRSVQISGNSVLAEDTDPRLNAGSIVIVPRDIGVRSGHGEYRLISVAVCMPNASYRQAGEVINQYLEQSGQTTYYGLGNMAYRGRRARSQTSDGLLELLIPLIIAALTVLNTMRGSVYERRDEIFVYNAVGIAPRYIFAMFFSEAFVYSIVGSVIGFLLSQGLGRLLTTLGWTGGLNMTFTSLNTIYASLAIMGAVFISTLFPALSAMKIAAPAEDAGWDLPEPEDDRMTFVLPFTFGARDRIAVLAFFGRYFADHGEGSSGRFFANPPRLGLDVAGTAGSGTPGLESTVWLKPFDLGVSQRLTIILPTDPETGEFAAHVTLTRLSGTRESWMRLNQSFMSVLRRHFLYWRAVSPADRGTLFAEARQALEQAYEAEEQAHA